MNRFNSVNGAAAAPIAPGAPANPYFTSGNPGGGVPATTPGAWWFHMMSEELRNAIVAAGLTPDHTNLGQLAQAISLLATSIPAGTILSVAAANPPTGYLKANGAAVSTTTYAALNTAIYCGDANNATAAWGYRATTNVSPSTNRSTTGSWIVLPDLRGEFERGWDDGRGIDSGRTLWSTQADDFKAHTHKYGATHNSSFGLSVTGVIGVNPGASTNYDTGSAGGTETRPRNVALLKVIKF